MAKEGVEASEIREYIMQLLAESAATTVAPLFRLYGWEYGGIGTPERIPGEKELEETVMRHLRGIVDGSTAHSSGRLMARRVEEDGRVYVEVSLELGRALLPGLAPRSGG